MALRIVEPEDTLRSQLIRSLARTELSADSPEATDLRAAATLAGTALLQAAGGMLDRASRLEAEPVDPHAHIGSISRAIDHVRRALAEYQRSVSNGKS